MLGSTRNRLRSFAALACGGATAVAILACAGPSAVVEEPQADRIADVSVESDGDATLVTLEGLDHPVFTAFAQTNPDRVVVDLASVRPDEGMDEVLVGDGLVEAVTLAPFSTGLGDPMTRIEVSLAQTADYDVTSTEDGLEIRISLADGSPEIDDPWAIEPMPASPDLEEGDDFGATDDFGAEDGFGEADDFEPLDEPFAPVAEAAPAATKLLAIEATSGGGSALVHLKADGMLQAESFTLEDPDRLVIDLPGVTSEVAKSKVAVDAPRASQVRVGQHADHVRVVIDGGAADDPFDGRRVVPTGGGLVVVLGSGDEIADAVDAALEPAGMPAPLDDFEPVVAELDEMGEMDEDVFEPIEVVDESDSMEPLEPMADEPAEPSDGLVTIYGVEYDAQQELDRIVVMGERPFDYLVYEPDAETVVLSIEKAAIDPEAAQRIAPDAGGPVSLVTAFAQPDVRTPEVRVVVKRAAGLKPAVSRRGSLLVMDFARDGRVAQTPPVLEKDAAGQPVVAGSEAAMPGAPSMPIAAAEGATGLDPASPLPAAPAPTGTLLPDAGASEAGTAPASLEPPASISVLEEGGLFDGKEYTGRRISLDFKDVEIADVLRLIAEVSDLNVIAGDEVQGRVTIRLVDVPWDQALDVILLTKSLAFMRVGNVLRIAPADVIKQEEEMRLQERRAKEKLEDLVVKLQPVNYADVADLERMVTRLLSPRGSVNVDKRTNTLIIKDIPTVIDEATALVKAIDTQTPQVMIEAKIVEASLDFSREFGSTWSFGAQPLEDAFGSGSTVRRDLGNDAFRLHNSQNSNFLGNNAQFLNPITAGPTALFNLAGFLLDEKLNLELQLQAAEVNGDGKVISSPRVVTLDNSPANIEQGVSIPFQTFENGDAQLEFVDAVLKLAVTPHITADKSIIMTVEVSRNAPDDSVFTLTGSPAIAKNQVQTETLVKDGQTLVLGGIYVIDKSERQSRVPYLHRIPLLGAAFRSDEISDSRKELLIFVTPHIVVTPQVAS